MQKNHTNQVNQPLNYEKNKIESPHDTINLYMHHLAQLDKLLSVIELLKKENKQLRHMLKINNVEITPNSDPSNLKPKITCWNAK